MLQRLDEVLAVMAPTDRLERPQLVDDEVHRHHEDDLNHLRPVQPAPPERSAVDEEIAREVERRGGVAQRHEDAEPDELRHCAHQQEGQVFLHERCAVDRAERPVPVQDEVEDVRAPEGDERVQQVVADAEVGGRDPEHRVVVVHMADMGADLGADRDDHHVDGDAGASDESELHELAQGPTVAGESGRDGHGRASLAGGFWHDGHRYDERFAKASRTTRRPHRRHGNPSRPYTSSDLSWQPDSPLTSTYNRSNDVPPWISEWAITSCACRSSPATFRTVTSELGVS